MFGIYCSFIYFCTRKTREAKKCFEMHGKKKA